MFHLLIITLVAPIIVWGITNPEKCETGEALPLAVRIQGCFPCSPCNIGMDGDTIIEIDFFAPSVFSTPHANMVLEFMDQKLDFLLELHGLSYICNYLIGAVCPLDKDERGTYRLTFTREMVDWFIVPIPLNITISFNEGGKKFLCFKVPTLFVGN